MNDFIILKSILKLTTFTPNSIELILKHSYQLYFQTQVLEEIQDKIQKERYNYLVKGLEHLFLVQRGWVKPSEVKFNPIYFHRTKQFLYNTLPRGEFTIKIYIRNAYMYLHDSLYFRDPILYEKHHKWMDNVRMNRIIKKYQDEYIEYTNRYMKNLKRCLEQYDD